MEELVKYTPTLCGCTPHMVADVAGKYYLAEDVIDLIQQLSDESDGPAQDVRALYEKYGFDEPHVPMIPEASLLQMRLNLILEELQELSAACGFSLELKVRQRTDLDVKYVPDPVLEVSHADIIDALVDLQVVILGTAYLFGFLNRPPLWPYQSGSYLGEAWRRVQLANMQKQVGVGKRGHALDLIKPAGWKPPCHDDLVLTMKGKKDGRPT